MTDWSCSQALSLTNPLRKGWITDWSWSEALSLANPYEKQLKGLLSDRSWSEAHSLTHPLQKAIEKATLQTGALLKHFPLQILRE